MSENKNKYDHLFQNVIADSMMGIRIFGMDDNFSKPQKYNYSARHARYSSVTPPSETL